MDVTLLAGELYLRENVSIPRIHNRLRDRHGVPICERSVSNLIDDYVMLCECVAGDSERVRSRLKQQGAIVLAVDGVQYDPHSPVLYVQRDVLSGEVLYGERRLARATEDLVPMLEKTLHLARDIGVPILGIISDKERSLVPAIKRAFPGMPHQYCQTHFLGNLAKAFKEDTKLLEQGAREVVLALREVQREMERAFPPSVLNGEIQEGGPRTSAATAAIAEKNNVASSPGTAAEVPSENPPKVQGACDPSSGERSRLSVKEAKLVAGLAMLGTVVGAVSGRPSVDPPGLKRYKRLEEVRASAKRCARRKGKPPGGWPRIRKLLAAFSPLDALRPVARRVDRHVQIVRHVAHIFNSRNSASQVKRVFRAYLNRLEREAPRRGRGAPTGHFIDHVVKVSNSYWPGLFHTYDNPKLPRNTNGLEGFLGTSKQGVRRTTGRKSTAGGKLESYGEALVRVQALLRTMPPDVLAERIAAVSHEDYSESKRRLRQLQEPARERRSAQRDRKRHVVQKETAWYDTS